MHWPAGRRRRPARRRAFPPGPGVTQSCGPFGPIGPRRPAPRRRRPDRPSKASASKGVSSMTNVCGAATGPGRRSWSLALFAVYVGVCIAFAPFPRISFGQEAKTDPAAAPAPAAAAAPAAAPSVPPAGTAPKSLLLVGDRGVGADRLLPPLPLGLLHRPGDQALHGAARQRGGPRRPGREAGNGDQGSEVPGGLRRLPRQRLLPRPPGPERRGRPAQREDRGEGGDERDAGRGGHRRWRRGSATWPSSGPSGR